MRTRTSIQFGEPSRRSGNRMRILPDDNGSAPLVSCVRFDARLTKAACLARYGRRDRLAGTTGLEVSVEACRGCAQGKGRAA